MIPVLWSSQNIPVFDVALNVSEGFDDWISTRDSSLFPSHMNHEQSPLVDCIRFKEIEGNLEAPILDYKRIRNTDSGFDSDEDTSLNLRNALAAHRRFLSMAESAHHESIGEIGLEGVGDEDTLTVLLRLFAHSVAYLTMVAAEESALKNDSGTNALTQISSQNFGMLRVLTENVLMALHNTEFDASVNGSLKSLVGGQEVMLPMDCFEMLCNYSLTIGGLESTLRLIYLLLIRVVLETIPTKLDHTLPSLTMLALDDDDFFDRVSGILSVDIPVYQRPELIKSCESSALVFMRKCVLLLHARFGLPIDSVRSDTHDELNHYTTILGLPKVSEILSRKTMESSSLTRLIAKWCKSPLTSYPTRLRGLAKLPSRHDEMNASTVCTSCSAVSTAYAKCMLCASPMHRACVCKRLDPIAGCLAHVKSCSGRTGMMALIESSHVMLIHGDFYCVVDSPYLDRHGELDPGLRKGAPLGLNERRMAEFRMMWVRMSVPELISQSK